MSSYDSNKAAYLHPQHAAQPPYPTTPGPPAQNQAPPLPFYPPPNQPQQQQHYFSTSPTSAPMPQPPPSRRRTSSSYSANQFYPPTPQPQAVQALQAPPPVNGAMPMPIPIRQPSATAYRTPPSSWPPAPVYAQQMPVYARTSSHASAYQSNHDPNAWSHAYGDGEDFYSSSPHSHHSHSHSYSGGTRSRSHSYENGGAYGHYGVLDEETERAYEKRYAREKKAERALEGRPTIGESVLSMVGKVGSLLGGERK